MLMLIKYAGWSLFLRHWIREIIPASRDYHFGLPAETAHRILSATAAVIKEGEEIPLHEPVGNIIGGDLKVIFKPLDHTSYTDYLGVAITVYDTKDFRTTAVSYTHLTLPTKA